MLRGQIVRGLGPDTVPLADQWAVLHRVDRDGGAPVDSLRTDARGRYLFRLSARDTGAVFFIGTSWQDIAYLTSPVDGSAIPDSTETLVVWDTTRTGVPIAVAQRHLIVRTPDASGARRVLELVVLDHRGSGTRVGTGPAGPVWRGMLPDGAFRFEVGESDMSAQAVREAQGGVEVLAPMPPGDRQLLYTYMLPGSEGTLDLSLLQPVERLTILLEDTAAVLVSGPLADRGIEVFEDAQFRLFEGVVTGAGARVSFRFSRGLVLSERMTAILLALGVALLVGVMVIVLRRRRRLTGDPEALARQIATLDALFEARGLNDPVTRRRYQAERDQLRDRLDRALQGPEPDQE